MAGSDWKLAEEGRSATASDEPQFSTWDDVMGRRRGPPGNPGSTAASAGPRTGHGQVGGPGRPVDMTYYRREGGAALACQLSCPARNGVRHTEHACMSAVAQPGPWARSACHHLNITDDRIYRRMVSTKSHSTCYHCLVHEDHGTHYACNYRQLCTHTMNVCALRAYA